MCVDTRYGGGFKQGAGRSRYSPRSPDRFGGHSHNNRSTSGKRVSIQIQPIKFSAPGLCKSDNISILFLPLLLAFHYFMPAFLPYLLFI